MLRKVFTRLWKIFPSLTSSLAALPSRSLDFVDNPLLIASRYDPANVLLLGGAQSGRSCGWFLSGGCVYEGIYDVHRYSGELLISPRYRIFPPSNPRLLSSLLSLYTDFLSYRSLSQTKQSRSRSDSPYVRLLGDNLYTRPPL